MSECRKCGIAHGGDCPAYGSIAIELMFIKSCDKCGRKLADEKARPLDECWHCCGVTK